MSSKIYRESEEPVPSIVWPKVAPVTYGPPQQAEDPAEGLARRIAALEKECERRAREAHQAGIQEGQAAGRQQAAAELKSVVERLAATIEEIAQFRPRLRHQAEADVVKLSLAIARRILHRELAVDPEAMRGLVHAAFEKIDLRERCRVRINPQEEAVVRASLASRSPGRQPELIADASLPRGAAVFETEHGSLDASVETQLQEIEHGLADRLGR